MFTSKRLVTFSITAFILLASYVLSFGQDESQDVSKFRHSYNFKSPGTNSGKIDVHGGNNAVNSSGSSFSSGNGGVTWILPMGLEKLIELQYSKKIPEKVKGWRIQIYAGEDEEIAKETKKDFLEAFPESDMEVYILWELPHFRVRAGDFFTKAEGLQKVSQVRQVFPDAFIVETEVNTPKIRKPSNPDEKLRDDGIFHEE